MNVLIESIPHIEQLYETCGNWRFGMDGYDLVISVSHTTDDHDFLIALHELVEAWLCRARGITEKRVTDFDIAFEQDRARGAVTGEPGDHPKAPYRREHFFATSVERLVAAELGIDWQTYERRLDEL